MSTPMIDALIPITVTLGILCGIGRVVELAETALINYIRPKIGGDGVQLIAGDNVQLMIGEHRRDNMRSSEESYQDESSHQEGDGTMLCAQVNEIVDSARASNHSSSSDDESQILL